MANTIRTGVVGLGYFGSFHANHYARLPGAVLVGVVDSDPGKADAAAAAHKTRAYSDHRSLIGAVDAVSITVPTSLHHRVARDFIDAGVHVLIEKPVSDDVASAEDLVDSARRAGVVLQVGHIERFSPTFAALRAEVTQPRFIDCIRVGPWTGRSADVDVVLDLMIHDIDLALTLAAAPVTDVEASGAAVVSARLDQAEARIGFANGAVARLFASRAAPAVHRQMTVHEGDRVLVADLAARKLLFGARRADGLGAGAFAYETVDIAAQDALAAEIASFIGRVGGEWSPGADGSAGLAALKVAERIKSAIDANAVGKPTRPI